MQIQKDQVDDLNAVITITLEQTDYEPKYRTALQEQRKKAHMKGFRKGKTPMGIIRKLYGKAILADVVNETLQKTVVDYLTEQKINFLGQPLPSADQEDIHFDTAQLENYVFRFDLGLMPEFEVDGIEGGEPLERLSVEVPDERVQEELENGRRRLGKQVSVGDDIEEKDILHIQASELEGEEVKDKGWETDFKILVESMEEPYKEQVISFKKGDTFRFDIYQIEKNTDEAFVKKHLLNLDEDEEKEIGNMFEGKIIDVQRIQPAAMDTEFFDQFFGEGKVTSTEEAEAFIRKEVQKEYDRQADALLYRDIRDRLMEANQFDLPKAFLERWLKTQNPEIAEEHFDDELEAFMKGLRWNLIRGKIEKRFDLQVEEQEIRESAVQRVRYYMGAYQDEMLINQLTARLLSDQEQVRKIHDEILTEKVFENLKEVMPSEDKPISLEAFTKEMEKLNTPKQEQGS